MVRYRYLRFLMEANKFVQIIENRQGLKVGCPEEIAYRMKYIYSAQLIKIAEPLKKLLQQLFIKTSKLVLY